MNIIVAVDGAAGSFVSALGNKRGRKFLNLSLRDSPMRRVD